MKQLWIGAIGAVIVFVGTVSIAIARDYTYAELKILRCDFPGPKGGAQRIVAEIDPENQLHGAFTYVASEKNVLHFSAYNINLFAYDGKLLDFDADSKTYGALKVHLGPKSDTNNLVTWKSGKDSFELHPAIDACKVVRQEDYQQ